MLKDRLAPSDNPSRRHVHLSVGPLVIWSVDIGHSSLLVGKYLGRINVPGNGMGYIWICVDVMGKNLFLGSVSLV